MYFLHNYSSQVSCYVLFLALYLPCDPLWPPPPLTPHDPEPPSYKRGGWQFLQGVLEKKSTPVFFCLKKYLDFPLPTRVWYNIFFGFFWEKNSEKGFFDFELFSKHIFLMGFQNIIFVLVYLQRRSLWGKTPPTQQFCCIFPCFMSPLKKNFGQFFWVWGENHLEHFFCNKRNKQVFFAKETQFLFEQHNNTTRFVWKSFCKNFSETFYGRFHLILRWIPRWRGVSRTDPPYPVLHRGKRKSVNNCKLDDNWNISKHATLTPP